MGRFSIPPGMMKDAGRWLQNNIHGNMGHDLVRNTKQAAGVVGANVKAGIQLAKDHPVTTSGIGVVGLAAGGITGYAGMGNQSNPRPTTPTPAEDAGSVSPTAPVGNRATRSMGESSSPDFIQQATGALNNFLGTGHTTALGSRVKMSGGEVAHMQTKGYQQGIHNMYMNDSFRWGGVDREWAKVSKSQMEQAGVSQADLARYSMQSEPQGNYAYRGSNQAQIEQAVGMKNAAYGGGDSVYIPVAKGKGDMLNQYLTSRMGKK